MYYFELLMAQLYHSDTSFLTWIFIITLSLFLSYAFFHKKNNLRESFMAKLILAGGLLINITASLKFGLFLESQGVPYSVKFSALFPLLIFALFSYVLSFILNKERGNNYFIVFIIFAYIFTHLNYTLLNKDKTFQNMFYLYEYNKFEENIAYYQEQIEIYTSIRTKLDNHFQFSLNLDKFKNSKEEITVSDYQFLSQKSLGLYQMSSELKNNFDKQTITYTDIFNTYNQLSDKINSYMNKIGTFINPSKEFVKTQFSLSLKRR